MFDCLDILAVTGALPSSAYLGMSVAEGSFNPVAYCMAVAHEDGEEKEERGKEE